MRLTTTRAFTMIEVAIALVIIGLVAAISFPRVAAESRRLRVAQAAQVVAADFEMAASLAAQWRRPVRLRWNASDQRYDVGLRDTALVLARRSLGAGTEYHLERASFEPAVVDFYPGGTLSTTVRATLSIGNIRREVSMTRAGLVRARS